MNTKMMILFSAVFSVLLGLSFVNAGQDSLYEPGSASGREPTFKNIRSGYTLFRENCKTCHYRNNDAGASFLCPDSKTMKGWNRVFTGGNSKVEEKGCLKGLSKEQQMDLNDFLYTHASDARNPHDDLECGI